MYDSVSAEEKSQSIGSGDRASEINPGADTGDGGGVHWPAESRGEEMLFRPAPKAGVDDRDVPGHSAQNGRFATTI